MFVHRKGETGQETLFKVLRSIPIYGKCDTVFRKKYPLHA